MRLGLRWGAYLFSLAPLGATAVQEGGWPPLQDVMRDIGVGFVIASLVTIFLYQEWKLLQMATVDALTGCGTVRRFEEELTHAVARAVRGDRPLALLYADLDNFKQVNDKFGHRRGDELLRQFAGILRKGIRHHVDLVFRMGGDEFAIILADASRDAGIRVGERIKASVDEAMQGVGVTVSIGVAELRRDELPTQLVQRADTAMYQAKQGGKDRMVAA